MAWPLSQDYNEAIQNPGSAFSDPELRKGEPAVNALGLPMPRSGNFADVYEFRCPDRKWAVKCFTREVPGLRDRYREVSYYLRGLNLPFMVDFKYLDEGIRIRGKCYPVLKMHWVEGLTLNEFVREHLDKPQTLEMLAHIWIRLSRRLRASKLAHCDLQHGNVLLVPGSKASALAVKLIDYDGMCVPVLASRRSGEVGHPAYQHPQRLREGTYSAEVDRFPNLVIYSALRAVIAGGRPLWQRYDNGDNLLFREQDLRSPRDSALFWELVRLNDPELRRLADGLSRAVYKPLDETPLLEELLPDWEAAPTKSRVRAGRALSPEMIFGAATAVDGPQAPRRLPVRPRKTLAWLWVVAACVLTLAGSLGAGIAFLRPGGAEPVSRQVEPGPDEEPAPRPPEPAPVVIPPQPAPRVEPPPKPVPPPTPDQPEPPPVLPRIVISVPTKTAWVGGVPGKGGAGPFEDSRPNDLLVGFDVYRGKDGNSKPFIAGIAPVYTSTPRDGHERIHGKANGPVSRIVGGRGEAVASIVAQGEGKVYGFQVIFMRGHRHRLDGSARSESPWVGGHGGREVVLGGDGSTVVGIYGNGSDVLERVGLIRMTDRVARPDPAARARARAWIDRAFKKELAAANAGQLNAAAANLLWRANRIEDLATRFVVLDRSRELATRAGAWGQAFSAVDRMTQAYEVTNALDLKADALQAALMMSDREGAGAGPQSDPAHLPGIALPLADKAVATHDFKAARSLLLTAQTAAHKFQDQATETLARNRLAEVEIIARGGRLTTPVVKKDPEKKRPTTPEPPPPTVQRLPIPGEQQQARAEAEIKELFKDEYTKRKPAGRLALAAKLLKQAAGTKDKPAEAYVLLHEAQELAAEAGDAEAALEAIALLDDRYLVDRPAMQRAALERATRSARTPAAAQGLVASYVALIDDAMSSDFYDAALALLTQAETVASRAKNSSFTSWLRLRKQAANQFREEFQQLGDVQAALRKNLRDPVANSAMGRFLCLAKGDWSRGLPFLSAGDDRKLKALAARDMSNVATATEQADVADAYYDRAQAEQSTAKLCLLQRAYYWYQRAAPRLDGLSLTRVHKRMKELERRPGLWLPEVVGCSRRFAGHTEAVLSVAVAPDGRTALSGSKDRTMRLWDLDSGTEVRRFNYGQAAVRCVALDPDGGRAVSGGENGTAWVWDLKTGRRLRVIGRQGDQDVNIVFLPQDRGFLVAGRLNFLQLWAASGASGVSYQDPNWSTITCLGASADGRIAVFGMVNGSARVFDLEAKRELLLLIGRKAEMRSVAVSRDGLHAVSGSDDKMLSLWDLKTGRELLRSLKGHLGPVSSVALSPDGRRILSGSEDGTVRLWDVKTGKQLLRLDGHRPVRAVAFTPDGRHVLSAGDDKTLRCWVVATGPALPPRPPVTAE